MYRQINPRAVMGAVSKYSTAKVRITAVLGV